MGKFRQTAAALSAAAVLAACGGSEFLCAGNDDCGGTEGGQCVQGYCAFPDDRCPSGLRFGQHSGSLSNKCVEGSPEATSTSGIPLTGGGSASSFPSSSSASSASASGPSLGSSETSAATTGTQAGDAVFRDDELAGEFGAGLFSGAIFADARLKLDNGAAEGTFLSRVFDAGAPVRWEVLVWEPDAPYAKPLPDGGASEVGYLDGAVSMADNVLLFHFDETGALGDGAMITDSSGAGNDGTIASLGSASDAVTGVFGRAQADHLDAYVSIPADTDDFDFGDEDFSWAIWFNFDHACSTNNVFIGVDDVVGGTDPYPHLWLGCTENEWTQCPMGGSPPRPGGVFRSVQSTSGEGTFYCGNGPINDGVWHHLAVVKAGHVGGEVRLYVDGERDATHTATFDEMLDLTQGGDFAVGGFTGATFETEGTFDDAAIWKRALSDQDIAALYRRGSLRVEIEVRACTEAECADEPPFVGGPSLQPGATFTDPAIATSPGTEISIEGLPEARYVQYRIGLDGLPSGATPAIAAVELRGVY